MSATAATTATPGRRNEDHFAIGPDWAFVLDGATAPAGVDSGCVHDVVWLVRRLGGALAELLTTSEDPLPDVLAEAIDRVRAAHAGTCDLNNPNSPSSTVTVLRLRERAEHLVLADSPLVLDVDGDVRPIVDDRIDRLPSYTREAVAELRNSPHGFWVASTDPEAAHHAVTGTTAPFRRAALLTDGASRHVDHFALADWPGLLDLLDARGPSALLSEVRQAETTGTPPRRAKPHDDATVVHWTP
ncbi:protein phosphatase 2C domain-containing protein [Saccharopolyspora mangrovi]|uniref:Protein phosphatase 2C domain-containing protein n=1 Tax=Saccharopolyspora mangrovi TaxID=3082379 RepID=A0ABU6A315_9PSEU|nr:protein phosphatase 2C domain-containing protein [Saccharopolyspora sp. S2-29]MEB3365881.1 protein phosphatase 2C domain-containing protein [Saccharopolyspora sp. S2-29]